MLKFLNKYLDVKLITSSSVIALLYLLLFDSSIVFHKVTNYDGSFIEALIAIGQELVATYIGLFLLFFGLLIYTSLFTIFSIFLFFTGALASYYLFFFGISPDVAMMPAIFGTNISEATELVSTRLIVWVLCAIGICFYAISHFKIQNTKSFITKILMALCLLLSINNILRPYFLLASYYPFQYLHSSYIYFFGDEEERERENISHKFGFSLTNDEEIIGVLVIGESARYQNFGINGYERDTTPELAKVDNLFSFKGRSAATITYLSIPSMLSHHGEDNVANANKQTGILSVLTHLGFNTTWIGTQSLKRYYTKNRQTDIYSEINNILIPAEGALYSANSHDGLMLPMIKKTFENTGKSRNFLVIHTTGSHWNYAERYPQEFEKFTPAVSGSFFKKDPASCSLEELVNSYDNSILYTDFFSLA